MGADVQTVEAALVTTKQSGSISKAAKQLAAGRGETARAQVVAQQFNLFGGPFAGLLDLTNIMLQIVEMGDTTLADVHESARLYADFQAALTPYKQALDLWVSRHFGNAGADEFLEAYPLDVLPALRGERKLTKKHQRAIDDARTLWQEKRFFHWDLEFPEVFVDLEHRDWAENPGFDAVIGNPPYVSAWSMYDSDKELRKIIEEILQINDFLNGHWDLYIAFLGSAYILTRRDGLFAFIMPNPFSREKYALSPRRFLLENTVIHHFRSFDEENVFDEVSRLTIVPVIQKSVPDYELAIISFDYEENDSVATIEVPQKLFLEMPEYQIRWNKSAAQLSLITKIMSNAVRLGEICYVNYGAQISSKEKGAFKKSDVITTNLSKNDHVFFDGKNLSRYEISLDGRYLDYRPNDMYGPRAPELFESPKLVLRDVTGADEQLIVSFDDRGYYCDHLIICATYYENVANTPLQASFSGYEQIVPPYPDFTYMAAVLASRLMTWLFRQVFATGTLQGSYSHTYPQQIRAFPIRRINFTTPEPDRTNYLTEAKALYTAFLSHENSADFLTLVGAHLQAEADRSDVIHDLLAFLAERMIECNKQKQKEIQSFLTWLARQIGTDINSLTNKTSIQNYLGDYQKGEEALGLEQLFAVLSKNRRKLTVDPLGRAFQERVETEYKASLAKLLPLKAQLAATDALIDRIVYRLYGLTEEEIALVEGRG